MPDQRPVAIANTSPLQYLHQCGLSDLLPVSTHPRPWQNRHHDND